MGVDVFGLPSRSWGKRDGGSCVCCQRHRASQGRGGWGWVVVTIFLPSPTGKKRLLQQVATLFNFRKREKYLTPSLAFGFVGRIAPTSREIAVHYHHHRQLKLAGHTIMCTVLSAMQIRHTLEPPRMNCTSMFSPSIIFPYVSSRQNSRLGGRRRKRRRMPYCAVHLRDFPRAAPQKPS